MRRRIEIAPGVRLGLNDVSAIFGIGGLVGSTSIAGISGAVGGGSQGPKGDKGDQGDTGDAGPQGSTGATGSQGPAGAEGAAGATGAVGATGATGPTGNTGATGSQGPQGDPGNDGADGSDGTDGATGATGPQGDTGTTGAQGAQGAQGIQGIQGVQGDTGDTGPQGPAVTDASTLSTGTLPIARIADAAVTYAKIQNVSATDKILGRSSSGAGVTEEIACTAAGRALIDDADASAQRTTLGLATVAASASAADLSTGILPDARMPDLTGDVTTVEGAVATTIGAGKVTNAMHANMATLTMSGNNTGGDSAPIDLTVAQVNAILPLRTDALRGLMPALMGRWASRTTTVSIANTLTQVVGATLAANTLAVGTVFRFRATGLLTNTTSASSSVLTIRISSGLTTPIVASWTVALGTTARTNCPFVVDGEFVVLTTGATGTAWGIIAVLLNSTTALALPTTQITSAVTIDTTSSRVIELACISGASTTTWNFITASVEVVQP